MYVYVCWYVIDINNDRLKIVQLLFQTIELWSQSLTHIHT